VLDGRCHGGRSARALNEPRHPELPHARGGGGRLWQHRQLLPEPAAAAADAAAAVHLAKPDIEGARLLIESVLAERRKVLTEMESKALLAAFHIPVTQTMLARSANEAMMIATQLGFPVALKIDSPDISHKSDVQGVALNVMNATAVRDTYNDMVERVAACSPTRASTA
jgi:acetyltransferase